MIPGGYRHNGLERTEEEERRMIFFVIRSGSSAAPTRALSSNERRAH